MSVYAISILCLTTACLTGTDSVETVLASEIDGGWKVRVLRNTYDEEWHRTRILTLVVETSLSRGVRRDIAWTHIETWRLWNGSELEPRARPTVRDVMRHDDSLLILHFTNFKNRLTTVKQDSERPSRWSTTSSIELDLSAVTVHRTLTEPQLADDGQIVQLDEASFVHLQGPFEGGHAVFRIMDGEAVLETDSSTIDRVAAASNSVEGEDMYKEDDTPQDKDSQ